MISFLVLRRGPGKVVLSIPRGQEYQITTLSSLIPRETVPKAVADSPVEFPNPAFVEELGGAESLFISCILDP